MIKISLSSVRDWIRDALAINPGRHEDALLGVVGPQADPELDGPPCGDEQVFRGSPIGHGGPHVCLCTRPAGHPDDGSSSDAWHRCGQVGGCGTVWATRDEQTLTEDGERL